MEPSIPQDLGNILLADELAQIPKELQQKLQKSVQNTYVQYCKEKAVAITRSAYEDKNAILCMQIQDLEEKLKLTQRNVDELRNQLDAVSDERVQLLEQAKSHESVLAALRNEKNDIELEKDMLLKTTERLRMELDWQKDESKSYLTKMNNVIAEKCTALAKQDEIESREMALELKEKRVEQEREMMLHEIEQLTNDLKRNMEELKNVRRESVIEKLEVRTQLQQKTEELELVQEQNAEYTAKVAELQQLLKNNAVEHAKTNEQQSALLDKYKLELDQREQLINLYVQSESEHEEQQQQMHAAYAHAERTLQQVKEQAESHDAELRRSMAEIEAQLEEKCAEIERLKTELVNANELLNHKQDESIDKAIAKMAPSAAIASRLIRTDFTLTELYTLYARSSTELEEQKKQTAQKDLQLQQIVEEFRERAPVYEQLENDHKRLTEAHSDLTRERDELLQKIQELNNELTKRVLAFKSLERHAKRQDLSNGILSQQLCHLLEEKEHLSIGSLPTSDRELHAPMNGNDVGWDQDFNIQKLMTFNDIESMQAKNLRLVQAVKELSEKLEEAGKKIAENEGIEQKLASAMERFKHAEERSDQKHSANQILCEKLEYYKKRYFALKKQETRGSGDMELDEGEIETAVPLMDSTRNDVANINDRISALEQNLKDRNELYDKLKEEYEYYRREKLNNDKLFQEQMDKLRSDQHKLQAENNRLATGLDFNKEQNDLLQRNEAMYKRQIEVLDGRCKTYSITTSKYEHNLQLIRDTLISEQNKLAIAETTINNLRHELRVSRDCVERLEAEKQATKREQTYQTQLNYNIERIMCNMELSDSNSRLCIEQRLGEMTRELITERQRNKEQEGNLLQTINELRKNIEHAQKRLDEELKEGEKLRGELTKAREEIVVKTANIDELSKKLQASLTPQTGDSPFALAVKKSRELETELKNLKLENESLERQLSQERAHAKQYQAICENSDREIRSLREIHETNSAKLNEEIKQLRQTESLLQARISELESVIALERVTEQSKNVDLPEMLRNAQADLKESLMKNTEQSKALRALREENLMLKTSWNTAQSRYTNEMAEHVADLQRFEEVKAQLLEVQAELDKLRSTRDAATENYEQVKKSYEEMQSVMQREKDEYEKRIADLNAANTLLHEQMESLTEKLATLNRNSISHNESTADDSLMDTSATDLNHSGTEDQAGNAQRLLQMIKYLRKEKNIITAQMDIFKAEKARLLCENGILQKRVDELTSHLNQERSNSETQGVIAVKHENTMRQLQTFNTVFDSNTLLRNERNELSKRVAELESEVKELTEQLSPLKETNLSLSKRIEDFNEELKQAQLESSKWRQRSNTLVEKASKNPEEFKRLQMERENLAQLLSAANTERESLLNELSGAKNRLLTELPGLAKQLALYKTKYEKLEEESRSSVSRNSQDIAEMKNRLLQREELLQKFKEDLEAKESLLQDSKSKETQLRKIAKKYKDQYESHKKVTLENNPSASNNVENLESSVVDENINSELENMRAQMQELSDANKSLQEQLDTISKAKDVSVESEEQSRALLRESKAKIAALSAEMATLRNRVQTPTAADESADNSARADALEEALTRMQKEMQDLVTQSKDSLTRLAKENESLQSRVNQLSRQLGLQQSAKPSTSSVANTEKGNNSEVRTANVKPMSGSNVQQSVTVQPWRGAETPFASIRPISMQNSRTAAIMPTSQQMSSNTLTSVSGTSSSTGTTGNTVLVPPQQQVHTTGSNSLETIASSSPTSSHTDYMPSTSTATVAVLAVPPMGTASPSTAESSQEAESMQQAQQNDAQPLVVSGGATQAVALVSPRVEGSSSSSVVTGGAAPITTAAPSQDLSGQQPSTSGSSGSSSLSSAAVSSHSRHTPSSSSVTTTQASLKRPREPEGDSSTNNEDGASNEQLSAKQMKRLRAAHGGDSSSASHVGYSSIDADQLPTSSQRDVASDDEDDEDNDEAEASMADADDGGEGEQHMYDNDGYGDQHHEADQNEGAEVEQMDTEENDNNEVDVDEASSEQPQYSGNLGNDTQPAASAVLTSSQDNNQQSQAISSGSGEPPAQHAQTSAAASAAQSEEAQCRNASSSSSGDDENEGNVLQEDAINEGSAETDEQQMMEANAEGGNNAENDDDDAAEEPASEIAVPTESSGEEPVDEESGRVEQSDQADSEGNSNSNATQSEIEDGQGGQVDHDFQSAEDNEGADGVTSEGEKQAIEGVEEEGREAEATISPTINTRSRTTRGRTPPNSTGRMRTALRGRQPITWQDPQMHLRNPTQQLRMQDPGRYIRGGPTSNRTRRPRRPHGGNFY